MEIPMRSTNNQLIIVACFLLALFFANTHRSAANSITTSTALSAADLDINATITSSWEDAVLGFESAEDNDQEFLMDSEINRRILIGTYNPVAPGVLNSNPFCDSEGRIANCDSLRVNKQSRPCTVENRCARHEGSY